MDRWLAQERCVPFLVPSLFRISVVSLFSGRWKTVPLKFSVEGDAPFLFSAYAWGGGGRVEFCQVARAQTQTNRPHPRWTGYAHLTRPRLLPPTLLLLSWLAAFRSYLGTVFTRTFYTRCPSNRGKGEESKIRKEDLIALQLEIFIFRRMEFNRIFLILVSLYLWN